VSVDGRLSAVQAAPFPPATVAKGSALAREGTLRERERGRRGPRRR